MQNRLIAASEICSDINSANYRENVSEKTRLISQFGSYSGELFKKKKSKLWLKYPQVKYTLLKYFNNSLK